MFGLNNWTDFLVSAAIIVEMISVVVFLIGIIFLFVESKKKLGLKLIVGAVIAFVIGFGSCTAGFAL
jgi:hypothetical protein